MLILTLLHVLGAPTADTVSLKPAFLKAAASVLDSARAWDPPRIVGAEQLIIDRVSFEAAAVRAGSASDDWSNFAELVQRGAADPAAVAVPGCKAEKERANCTLKAGQAFLRVNSVVVKGGEIVLNVRISSSRAMVQYAVHFRKGEIVQMERTMQS